MAVFSVQYGAYPLRDGSLLMQREMGGGGGCGAGRETRRKESRLFQITKIGGLNSLIKKFRGVVSSLIASYIFQILKYSFFSWFQSCT